MAVFRIEKTRDYTVMSNHHFRNPNLSLKAKGLLSQMLSFPEDWDYTLHGLSKLSRDGLDSTRKGLDELEAEGYLVRKRVRNAQGQLKGTEYVIYESPVFVSPAEEEPMEENPTEDMPTLENPTLGNPTQLNTKLLNTKLSSTELINNSFHPSGVKEDFASKHTGMDRWRDAIKQQIEYDFIKTDRNHKQLDELVEIMMEVRLAQNETIRIGKEASYPTAFVQERFSKLDSEHVQTILDCISQNTTRVRNIKAYLLSALFNAPAATDNYYTMLVNHDMYSGA